MKSLFAIMLILLLSSCGKDEVNSKNDNGNTGNTLEKPVAVDDAETTTEDMPVTTNNVLANDTTPQGTRVKSFDATSQENGEVVDNRNGTFTYSPKIGFVGVDSFTYTICDTQSPENCATAKVSIYVADEGSPTANDDAVNVIYNTAVTLYNLLTNDDLTDDAQIAAVDGSSSKGSVVLNNDNTITYTPLSGSLESDSFTYTICDDDSPDATCSTATVSVTLLEPIAFTIPASLQSYYEGVFFTSDASANMLVAQSHTRAKHTTILTYTQRHTYLYDADEDLNNADNVILIYSGESRYWKEYASPANSYSPQTFNTEHVYPQSRLNAEDAVTDLHHLRSCDEQVNSDKSNLPFVDGTGDYKRVGSGWFPGDSWKGDVARMVLYLNVRYDEVITDVGTLELFLKWNIEDPVSPFEQNRNDVIEAAQGNRNPFIDNPYLVTLIWGGDNAENTWD